MVNIYNVFKALIPEPAAVGKALAVRAGNILLELPKRGSGDRKRPEIICKRMQSLSCP